MAVARIGVVLSLVAAASLSTLAAQAPSVDELKTRVRTALRFAEFDSARRDAEALVAAAPADAEALALSGDALWGAGLFDEAEAAYGRSGTIEPASARARFGLARSLLTKSRFDEALSQALAASAAAPDDPDLHALVGTIYERMNRYPEAAAAYRRYADLVPPTDAAAIYTSRSRAQFLDSFAGRTPLAIQGSPDRVHTVPFKLVKNKVVVQGRVNGVPIEWVLDTGAERTGISYITAASARIRGISTTVGAGVGRAAMRRMQLGRIDRLQIGSLQVRNVPASLRNPSVGGTPRWQGESLSPLALGLSLVVDYPRRQVILARTLPEAPAQTVLPLRMHRLPLVRGTVNSRHPASFVVDTGGEVISLSTEVANGLGMLPPRRIPLRVFGLSGLDEDAFLLPGVDLDFDEIEYRNVGLAVLNLRAPSVLLGFQVGGIIGHKFLGNYRVAVDVTRSELRLSR